MIQKNINSSNCFLTCLNKIRQYLICFETVLSKSSQYESFSKIVRFYRNNLFLLFVFEFFKIENT